MPNNCLSVLYKHIIQVENKNVGLKVCVCVGGGGVKQLMCRKSLLTLLFILLFKHLITHKNVLKKERKKVKDVFFKFLY